jgi:hypothetical protein
MPAADEVHSMPSRSTSLPQSGPCLGSRNVIQFLPSTACAPSAASVNHNVPSGVSTEVRFLFAGLRPSQRRQSPGAQEHQRPADDDPQRARARDTQRSDEL